MSIRPGRKISKRSKRRDAPYKPVRTATKHGEYHRYQVCVTFYVENKKDLGLFKKLDRISKSKDLSRSAIIKRLIQKTSMGWPYA